MIRHPPIPPPFPYTTLFRSRPRAAPAGDAAVPRAAGAPERHGRRGGHAARAAGEREPRVAALGVRAVRLARGDRKSTRLNSSHANISYAVFCLKKKNTVWSG